MGKEQSGVFREVVSLVQNGIKLGRATGNKEEIKILNAFLDAIQGNIFAIQKEYALRNETLAAQQVRSKILNKNEEKQHRLIEVYKYHDEHLNSWSD
jgi:hypothetical protein